MHEVMRFWLRKGVNGFRVDVIWHLIKGAGAIPRQSRNCRDTADQPPRSKSSCPSTRQICLRYMMSSAGCGRLSENSRATL